MNTGSDVVATLVARLPEVYQPIYGHADLSVAASRATEDRLSTIRQVHDALSSRLGRPLRVLDLGCAQGFISLTLASAGASVVAVEMLPENVALCRKLGELNPGLDVDFVEARIEDFIQSVESGSFDLVLLLSVIHHVAFHVSPEAAKSTVDRIRSSAPVLLAELALAQEPLYWASALPDEASDIFGTPAFTRELCQTGTHLSEVKRPLYFVSDSYWYAGGEVDEILQLKRGGHRFAKKSFSSSRTYYLSSDRLLKVHAIHGEDAGINRSEIEREAVFLASVEGSAGYPRVISKEEDGQNIYLVREKLPGRLLIDILDSGEGVDFLAAIRDVLCVCVQLEERGLYHQDVRVWNVLVGEDGKFSLIDYGAISGDKRDCFWPQNIYVAFLVFVKDILSAPDILVDPIREISVTPYGFPGCLSRWVSSLIQKPLPTWSFSMMLKELDASVLGWDGKAVEPGTAYDALLKSLEEAVAALARSQASLAENTERECRDVIEQIGGEARRISNLHHDILGLADLQKKVSEEQSEQASALGFLANCLEEQRSQGLEMTRQQSATLERQADLIDTLSRRMEEQGSQGLEMARQQGAALERQADLMDLLTRRLDGLENKMDALVNDFQKYVDASRVLHDGHARDLSEIKDRVLRKGVLARLFNW